MKSKKGSLNFYLRFCEYYLKATSFSMLHHSHRYIEEAGSAYADEKLTKPITGDFKDWSHEDYKYRNANGEAIRLEAPQLAVQ